MKNQRYRSKIIALLLVALLGLTVVGGIRSIPETESQASLRDSILRLTGQSASPVPGSSTDSAESPSVSPGASATAQPDVSTSPDPSLETDAVSPLNGLGQILFPSETAVSTVPSPETAGPSLLDGLGQVLFPAAETESPVPTPDEPTPVPPLSEALSNYFATEIP